MSEVPSITLAEVVLHDGQVVHETYGPDTGPDTTLISWSTGKSVTHALVGVAVPRRPARSRRAGAGTGVVRATAQAITLRELLAHASGLHFVEDYVDDSISHCIDMLFGAGQADVAALRGRPAARSPAWFRLQLLVRHDQHRQPRRRRGRAAAARPACGRFMEASCSGRSA